MLVLLSFVVVVVVITSADSVIIGCGPVQHGLFLRLTRYS